MSFEQLQRVAKGALITLAISASMLRLTPANALAIGNTEEPLINWALTGRADVYPEELNPRNILDKLPVQKLLLDIAAEPRDEEYIDRALEGISVTRQHLEAIRLVRRRSNGYVVDFTLLRRPDALRVRAVADRYAKRLARRYIERREELNRLLGSYDLQRVDRKELAFLLVGCFSLDWDGLSLTLEKGYRNHSAPRPNGSYEVSAEEMGKDYSVKGIYWGSHNEPKDDIWFTSFGDHYSIPRHVLPDLVWQMEAALRKVEAPAQLRRELATVGVDSLSEHFGKVGRLLSVVREEKRDPREAASMVGFTTQEGTHVLGFLDKLGYLREGTNGPELAVVVLAQRDARMVDEVMRFSAEIITAWLESDYETVRAELDDLSPVRAGVPYEVVFTKIWHYIFGMTNTELVAAGLFADPYAADREFKGSVPCVWHRAAYNRD